MSEWRITEEQLLALNTELQRADDVLVHNCVTRTAQESKLFPVVPYVMLVMIDAYWRYPDLLRTALAERTPEELGHRARETGTQLTRMTSWASYNYYVNGRNLLIRHGLLRPEDNLEDLWFMTDWYRRHRNAFHRAAAHPDALAAGEISPTHEERTLQVFEADAFEVDGDLRRAATKFLATATQYSFLVHCESRSGLCATGPYRVGDRRLMHVREFINLGESGLQWMNGVADEVPYNNLSLVLITDAVPTDITDWGTVYTDTEDYQDIVLGVGLYTSDLLEDRYVPVGMGSRRELVDTLDALTASIQDATRNLYRRFAGMSFDQMVEAGMTTYFRAPSEASMMAGTYRQADWDGVDERTRRLWPIYNEEYSVDGYVDHFNAMLGFAAAQSEYYLHPESYAGWRRTGGAGDLPSPGRVATLVPARVLDHDDYPRRVNPGGLADVRTSSDLPEKTGRYLFASGRVDERELNERARAFESPLLRSPWRNVDEQTVKWHWQSPEVDGLYRYAQERSRLLTDRGASLRREDVSRIRTEAGERPWSDVTVVKDIA
ncbi:MAG: hypothetical protein M0P31_04960 [Solirubrobacteraceae bacterium]|nr:hypothetical protein [Solirubrobacteraceae bacterium]